MTTALRLLSLADLPAPSAYGVLMAAPTLRWPPKHVAELLDYSLDVSDALEDVQDYLVNVSWSVNPSGSGELSPTSVAVSGNLITGLMSGGILGTDYRVKILAVTYGGRLFEWRLAVRVGSSQRLTPSSGIFGTPVTWTFQAGFDLTSPLNNPYAAILSGL